MTKSCLPYFSFSVVLLFLLASDPAQAQETDWQLFEDALVTAHSSGQPVLVHIWAPWCGWCSKMEHEVYPEMGELLSNHFVMTRVNRDDHETTHSYRGRKLTSFRLSQRLKAEAVPTIVLLYPNGEYMLHLTGYREADALEPVLDYIGTEIIYE